MPTIGILSAGVFGVFALSLVLPLFVALVEGNLRALEAIFLVAIGYGFLSAVTILSLSRRVRTLNRAGVFMAAITVWLSLIAAAVPLFILVEGQALIPAIFEASSAAVTLGATLRPPADISPSMTFYRATVAWVGGLTTLTLAVYVLGPYRVGGIPNANLRQVQHSRTENDPRILVTLRSIAVPYLTLTIFCAMLLIIVRVPADDAIVVAMSMLSTNGFVPPGSTQSVLDNRLAETVMMVFMLIGATSIIWHRLLIGRVGRDSREHHESVRYLVAIGALVALAILASIFAPPAGRYGLDSAFNYVFDMVSIATTTGVTHDQRLGVSIPFEAILIIVFIGGCSYSTAGGIKAFRLLTMLKHVGNELDRLVYPSAILRDDVQYDTQQRIIAKSVWSTFFLGIVAVTIALLIFAAQGHSLPAAMAIAAGSFSQVGNVVDSAIPGLSQGVASDATLLTISALAAIARIEILVVLAAITGNRW
ncbi:potassium transporter TrkG [Pelagibacterium sp.]|uniref:potassium transporter TrkG n=1 Tax=Pelagibacterium sp. TaxID=1967288 RepID=UPI003A94F179